MPVRVLKASETVNGQADIATADEVAAVVASSGPDARYATPAQLSSEATTRASADTANAAAIATNAAAISSEAAARASADSANATAIASEATTARAAEAVLTTAVAAKADATVDAIAATGSLRTLGTGAQQAAAGNDPRMTNARTPTVHATSHQPGGSDALAVDAIAATGSLRTLGTGAQQAAAGNDSRMTNARTPTAHATSHQPGGSDALAVDAIAATGSLRTLGTGAQQAAAGNHSHANGILASGVGNLDGSGNATVSNANVSFIGGQPACVIQVTLTQASPGGDGASPTGSPYTTGWVDGASFNIRSTAGAGDSGVGYQWCIMPII